MTDFVDDLERELLAAARRRRHPPPAPACPCARPPSRWSSHSSQPDSPSARGRTRNGPRPRLRPSHRRAARLQPQADVLVLNETRVEGLAAAIRDELYVRFRLDIAVDTGDVLLAHVTPSCAADPEARQLGRKVADALRCAARGRQPVAPRRTACGAQVLVLAGTDRMR